MNSKIILTAAIALISTTLFAQTPKAYITNYGSDFISVVDIQKNQKIADIKTGNKPHGVAVSPEGNWIAVSNEGDNTVSIITAADNKVTQTVSVGKAPHQLSFSRDGKYIFTAINAEHKVDVISTSNWKLINSIPVGRNPHIVLPMPDGKSVWVTSEGDNKIVKINLDSMKVVAEIPVFNFPRVMTATPDGKFIYLTWNWSNGDFTLTNLFTNNGTITIVGYGTHNTASNITNNGIINWNDGNFDANSGGQVLTNNGTLFLNSSSYSFKMAIVNTGTVTRTTSGTVAFSQPIDNHIGGTILIPSNTTFTFGTGSSLIQSGTFTVDGNLSYAAISVTQNALFNLNGTCTISAGTHNFGISGGFTGSGTLSVTGGTINFNSGSTHSGNLSVSNATFNDNVGLALQNVNINGGTYAGSGDGIINGILTWTNGGFGGDGTITVQDSIYAASLNPISIAGSKILKIAGNGLFNNVSMSLANTAGIEVLSGGSFIRSGTSTISYAGSVNNTFAVLSGGKFIKKKMVRKPFKCLL